MRYPVILVSLMILPSLFLGTVSASNPNHFVLVHGACLGAWSWYKIIPLLQFHGHNVTAIDLAASGINPGQSNEVRTFSDYTKPLMDFMETIPSTEKVILVGHSLGGGVISQAMELFPEKISVAIFLTAFMPGPSFPLSSLIQQALSITAAESDNELNFDNGPNNPPTSFVFGPKYLAQVVYQLSPPKDAALANTLLRPLPLSPLTSLEEVVFTEAKYGSVNRVFIIAEKDQVLTKQFQEFMIKNSPPNQVGRVGGSDHMVMASKPVQLVARLLGIAKDFS